MLRFRIEHGETDLTVTGDHYNEADSPALFAFSRTHALGTTRAAMVADLDAHLVANSRSAFQINEDLAELKLHRYQSTIGTDHRQVDYKTGLTARLEKKVTSMVDGEVREVEYHADDAFDDLVLKVAVFKDQALTTPGYTRTSNGLAVERWTERTWYREDDTAHPETKVTHKTYSHDSLQQMREGRRRRGNVIDQLSITVLNLLVATETAVDPLNPTPAEITAAEVIAMPWLATYDVHVNNYIRVGDLAWKTAGSPNLTDDTATWLDNDCEPVGYPASTTIRDVILGSLNEVS